MLAVADELRNHPGGFGSGTHHAGRAMQKRRHGVEEVGDMGHARRNRGLRLIVVRVRVRDGDRADLADFLDVFDGTRKFGRDVRNLNESLRRLVKPQKHLIVGVLQVRAVLRTLLLLREKRAFHVDAP